MVPLVGNDNGGPEGQQTGRGKCMSSACTARLLETDSAGNAVRQRLVQRSVVPCCLSVPIFQFIH